MQYLGLEAVISVLEGAELFFILGVPSGHVSPIK